MPFKDEIIKLVMNSYIEEDGQDVWEDVVKAANKGGEGEDNTQGCIARAKRKSSPKDYNNTWKTIKTWRKRVRLKMLLDLFTFCFVC